MTRLFAVVAMAALVTASQTSRAQDIARFAPLKADELVSMTLITAQVPAPGDSTAPPLPVLSK